MMVSDSDKSFRRYLRDLIAIPSPSGREGPVRKMCDDELRRLGFQTEIDGAGNLLASRGDGPFILLNAHMDTVQRDSDVAQIASGGLTRPRLDLRYGFDDKVGIAIILRLAMLKGSPFKVLLTVEEETGGGGVINVDPEFFGDVSLCITLDRGGFGDMVTSILGEPLAPDDVIGVVEGVLNVGNFRYERVEGRPCDARIISRHVPTVNLSVGIYEMHTKYEYVKIEEAIRTANAVAHLIGNRGSLMSPPQED